MLKNKMMQERCILYCQTNLLDCCEQIQKRIQKKLVEFVNDFINGKKPMKFSVLREVFQHLRKLLKHWWMQMIKVQ